MNRPGRLHYDPLPPLVGSGDPALTWAVRHDVLDESLDPRSLWELPGVAHAQRTQNPDGSWTYHGGSEAIRSREGYAQIATYQQLLVLVSKFRLDRRSQIIQRAAEFMFGKQARAGDIRGIYGTQYTPNYTADILRLLVEAGYQRDARLIKGIEWLLSMRQDDGGWAVPLRTAGHAVYARAMRLPEPIEPVRSRPSSHLITGIVLRPLVVHPNYRGRVEVKAAASWLASRFFTADAYVDRRDSDYWTKLAFPFRWTDLVSALDVVALAGLGPDHPNVARALRWLTGHQEPGGLWRSGYPLSPDPLNDRWVTFGVVRTLKRLGAAFQLRASALRSASV